MNIGIYKYIDLYFLNATLLSAATKKRKAAGMKGIAMAVMTPKGGQGKTPTLVHLARYAQLKGLSVIYVNTDKTGATDSWLDNRINQHKNGLIKTAEFPEYIYVKSENVAEYIKKAKKKYDIVLVDTQATFEDSYYEMLLELELVISPLYPRPENFDVFIKGLILILDYKEENNLERPFVAAAIVRAKKSSKNLASTIKQIKSYDIPTLDSKTRESELYSQAYGLGQTIIDVYQQAGTQTLKNQYYEVYTDIKLLCEEILELLKQIREDTV